MVHNNFAALRLASSPIIIPFSPMVLLSSSIVLFSSSIVLLFFSPVILLFSPMVLSFFHMVFPLFPVIFRLLLVPFSLLVSYIPMAFFSPMPYTLLTPCLLTTFSPWQLLRTTLPLPEDNLPQDDPSKRI